MDDVMMNYLLPPLTGGFWPVMVSVGSSRSVGAALPRRLRAPYLISLWTEARSGRWGKSSNGWTILCLWLGVVLVSFYFFPILAMAGFLSKERPAREALSGSGQVALPRNIHLFPFSLHLRPTGRGFTVQSGTACGSTQSKGVPAQRG